MALKMIFQRAISLTDLVLTNENNESLHPDLFLSGTELLKSVQPGDEINGSLAYLVSNKEISKYSFALVDPLDGKDVVKIPAVLLGDGLAGGRRGRCRHFLDCTSPSPSRR